jgi:hypothetical protein
MALSGGPFFCLKGEQIRYFVVSRVILSEHIGDTLEQG